MSGHKYSVQELGLINTVIQADSQYPHTNFRQEIVEAIFIKGQNLFLCGDHLIFITFSVDWVLILFVLVTLGT